MNATFPFPNTAHMKRLIVFGIVLVFLLILTACTPPVPANPSTLSQIATFASLEKGNYDGDISYARLKDYGDFGLGTFEGLDGEMIALNGVFYQAKADGTVEVADEMAQAPFADVHFFSTDRSASLPAPVANVKELMKILDGLRTKPNNIYAFRVKGTFPTLKVRSVPAQEEPYPPLSEAIAEQVVFEWTDMPGTLVGYWMPGYLTKVGVPGYHLHFISDDRQHGGHVLDCSLEKGQIEVDPLENLIFVLPQNEAFQGMDLAQ